MGMDWQGQARDALVARTTADKATVALKSDQLREAALTARKGAGDISALQRSVLYKVDDAHQAGFVVGEDLSVTDTRTSRNAGELAQRHAQAQAFSADIRGRAAQLLAADSDVGTKLTAAAGDVGSVAFDEKPIHAGTDRRNGKIQLVDWKQAPTTSPSPGHTGEEVRDAIKDLPKGTGPIIGEVRSEDDLRRLWNWATEGAPDRTPPSTYKGTEKVLRDGTIIGLRTGDNGLTLDFNPPNGPYEKVHVNAATGGVPKIPDIGSGAPGPRTPIEAPPAERAPIQVPAPRPAPAAPEPFVPMGPLDPNSFPHFVQPPHSHHGPPILGKDDLADLPEYEP